MERRSCRHQVVAQLDSITDSSSSGVLGVLVLLVLPVFLVFLIYLVFQGHHVLLVSLLVLLVQLPLVVQDNLGLPAHQAIREYLVLPVILLVPGDLGRLGGQEDREDPGALGVPLLAVVDDFHAVLGCSKWQAAIEFLKPYIPQ